MTDYVLDPTGFLAGNLLADVEYNWKAEPYGFYVSEEGYFYSESLVVKNSSGVALVKGYDYQIAGKTEELSMRYGKDLAYVVVIVNPSINKTIYITRQLLGGTEFRKRVDPIQAKADLSQEYAETHQAEGTTTKLRGPLKLNFKPTLGGNPIRKDYVMSHLPAATANNLVRLNGSSFVNGDITLTGTDETVGTNPLEAVSRKYFLDGVVDHVASKHTLLPGDLISYPQDTDLTPDYLRANGALSNIIDYPDLYAEIGNDFFNTGSAYSTHAAVGGGKPWVSQYETNTAQINSAISLAAGTAMSISVCDSRAVVTKNRVYLLGGFVGAAFTANIHSAVINADGTLGNFGTSSSLPGVLALSEVIVTKNRVYMLGGSDGTTTLATVYTAPINVDGTFGAWTTDTSIPVALKNAHAVVTKDRVYLFGGNNGTTAVSTIYTAPVNLDGTIGAWTASGNIQTAVEFGQAVVIRNYVYLIGGLNSVGTPITTVQRAPINTDGTLGTWAELVSLPVPLAMSQSFVSHNRIYMFSGKTNGSTWVSDVYGAEVLPNGDLGTWSVVGSTTTNLSESHVIAVRNKLYVLGGYSGAAVLNTTYVATIGGGSSDYSDIYDGTVNKFDGTDPIPNQIYNAVGSGLPWQQQFFMDAPQTGDITNWAIETPLYATISRAALAVTKNRVYLIGGVNSLVNGLGTDYVYSAPINADGTLGTLAQTGSPFLYAVESCLSFVTENYLYVVGGYSSGACTRALINSDGSLGAWESQPSLPGACESGTAILTKNRVYLMFASSGSHYTAPINSDGSLGTFETFVVAANGLTGGHRRAAIFAVKNKIYVVGGDWSATSFVSDIQQDGTFGPWSPAGNFPIGLYGGSTFVTNTDVYVLGGSGNDVVYRASVNLDGTLGTWVAGTSLPEATSKVNPYLIATKNHLYVMGAENTSHVYSAVINGGTNDYSPYYDGTINTFDGANPTLPPPAPPAGQFVLPDLTTIDAAHPGVFSYIKT